jgi:hypothetical protein
MPRELRPPLLGPGATERSGLAACRVDIQRVDECIMGQFKPSMTALREGAHANAFDKSERTGENPFPMHSCSLAPCTRLQLSRLTASLS